MRRVLAVLGVSMLVGFAVLLAVDDQSGAGQPTESSPQPLEEAPAPADLNGPVPPDTTPQTVSLGVVRHVDVSTLAPSTPAVPQEAPLPHAPKTPTGDAG